VELAVHRTIALAAFLLTYLGLALGRIPGLRVDRTGVAIIGAAIDLIVVEIARGSRIRIGFLEDCRVGVPLTLLTLLVGWLFLARVPV
jgi:hypothetical protein